MTMSREEAREILGPDVCRYIADLVADAPPLSEQQQRELSRLFRVDEPCEASEGEVA